MIAIPNMDKPQNITRCSYKINPEECKCVYTDKVFEETLALISDHPCPDCPIIDIVTCGECKHRPIKDDPDGEDYGFNLVGPNEEDDVCPCLVEDGWYSWMPEDNFYCGRGERRSE